MDLIEVEHNASRLSDTDVHLTSMLMTMTYPFSSFDCSSYNLRLDSVSLWRIHYRDNSFNHARTRTPYDPCEMLTNSLETHEQRVGSKLVHIQYDRRLAAVAHYSTVQGNTSGNNLKLS
jgi:hypothetical protein